MKNCNPRKGQIIIYRNNKNLWYHTTTYPEKPCQSQDSGNTKLNHVQHHLAELPVWHHVRWICYVCGRTKIYNTGFQGSGSAFQACPMMCNRKSSHQVAYIYSFWRVAPISGNRWDQDSSCITPDLLNTCSFCSTLSYHFIHSCSSSGFLLQLSSFKVLPYVPERNTALNSQRETSQTKTVDVQDYFVWVLTCIEAHCSRFLCILEHVRLEGTTSACRRHNHQQPSLCTKDHAWTNP